MHAVGNSLIQCRGLLYERAATALRTAFRQMVVFSPHRAERASLRKWHDRHWDVCVLQNFFQCWVGGIIISRLLLDGFSIVARDPYASL
jgi:hypothetical protein